MTYRNCPSCDAEVDVGLAQCPQCGESLATPLLAVLVSPEQQWEWTGQELPERREKLASLGIGVQPLE